MRRFRLAALGFAGLVFAASAAWASLGLAPVSFELSATQKTASVEVWNPGSEPVDVQVRMFRWNNAGQDDAYAPTDDLGFSPPQFRLVGGARQVVRLAWRGEPAEQELAYRVFIDQLPKANVAGVVQLPVRMVLPLFVEPAKPVPGRLAWRLENEAETDAVLLVADNSGGQRVRLRDLAYVQDGVVHLLQEGLAGYVLAGQSRAWRLPPTAAALKILSVRADTDDGSIAAQASFQVK